MNRHLLCLLLLCSSTSLFSQYSKYVIRFKDKNNSPYSLSNPSAYLSAKSIQRRANYGIAMDSTDLPVNPSYIQAVLNTGAVTLLNRSKWLNAITIQTTDAAALTAINNLPFVQSYKPIALRKRITPVVQPEETEMPLTGNYKLNKETADYYNYGVGASQIQLTNGQFLHNIGLRGQTITMSLLDGGFFGYQTNTAFDSARKYNQFLGTWDFVDNQASVNEDNAHGMNCLSIIAANWPGTLVGTAPEAKFWLLRTEAPAEQPIEEYNWASGAEYADSVGTDIISSSLGYTDFDDATFNHTYTDMNGNTVPCTIAADLAAKKGILVVNSAGNSGNSAWKYIAAPADGDSVFCIGATNTSGTIASFSSYGPSYDGQIKPDVVTAGAGIVVAGTNSQPATNSGTSFSCPNIAGLSACLWQAFPEVNNMKIIDVIRKSADRYNSPDDRYGFGIPNMKTAFGILLKEFATAAAIINNCQTTLTWTSRDLSMMRYELERKLPGETVYTKIAEVNAQGNTLAVHNYQYTDNLTNANPGNISYRIRQLLDTALASLTGVYIDTADVNLDNTCLNSGISHPLETENQIIVYPNPVEKELTASIYTKNPIPQLVITIHDITGKLVYQARRSKPAGKTIISIPAAPLSRGEYLVSCFEDTKKISSGKFIKQ